MASVSHSSAWPTLVELMLSEKTRNFGWQPDLPDHRDYSPVSTIATTALGNLKLRSRKSADLPARVDWREYCGPIEDQEDLATSTAHACVALIQQFERRSTGRLLRLSRLFVHRAGRRFPKCTGDDDLSIRAVLKGIVQFGVPPERYWPYDAAKLGCEPDPFTYSFQRGYRTLRYVRLDGQDASGEHLLLRLKVFLAAGFSFAFGFPLCSSVNHDGDIPSPTSIDTVLGGHSVTAVGYDDKRRIRSDKGALLVRNSWGHQWGDGGFGWLPYAYVEQRLARDFWTLLKPAWLRSGEFKFPR